MPGNLRATFSSGQSGKGKRPSQAATSLSAASSLLNAEKLRALYAAMVKCRMLQEKLGTSARRRERAAHFELGAEAVLAGTVCDLLSGDCIAPSPRSSLARMVKGTAVAEIFSAHAKARQEPQSGPLQLGIGAGLALALKRQKQSNVALCMLDEGLLANDGWKEAVAFAAERKLPLVCVVETRSIAKDLRAAADGCGAPAITVDGSDVVAVYRVMQEATRRARQGHGPTLIQGKLLGADPLDFMENYLRKRDLWSDAWREKLIADFRTELQRAGRARK